MVPASWFDRASGSLSVRFGASPQKRPRSSPCPLCLTAQRSEQGKTRVAKSGSAAVVNLLERQRVSGRYLERKVWKLLHDAILSENIQQNERNASKDC